MAKLTKEQFIERARAVHGDKYDYSKVEYVNNATHVCIICPEHGEFWQVAGTHLCNHGCPQCASEKVHVVKKWTYEACYNEAKKYTSRIKFAKESASCYGVARKNGWLNDYTWFIPGKLENGYWNIYGHCFDAAQKYTSRSEFQRKNCGAYEASKRNGWIDKFTWLTGLPPDMTESLCDNVYVYEFKEYNTVYVGRTININETIRRHRSASCNDVVYRFAKDHNINVPEMRLLESNITILEGKEKEDFWKNIYLDNGYNVLNIAKTGKYSGSIGNLGSIYDYSLCEKLAQQCTTITEFSIKFKTAYKVSLANNWLERFIWFEQRQKPKRYWAKEKCMEAASKCSSISEFQKQFVQAYAISRKNGWIDEWFNRKIKRNGYWTKERCYEAAKECSTQREFLQKYPRAHTKSTKNKWMQDYTWFIREKKPNGYWDKEHCKIEALKHSSIIEFEEANSTAYDVARRNGWIDEWFTRTVHKKNYWTKDKCEEMARKCKTRKEFQDKYGSAYSAARKHGWIRIFDFFVEKKKPNGYWTKERCSSLARQSVSLTEFEKKYPSACVISRRNGWLDEFFPKKIK